MPTPILSCVEAIYVINLPSRRDRRREIGAQLARLGLSFDNPAVILFPAVRPDIAGDFPSIGARGCFLSHLGVLKAARNEGRKSILILEDDADFTSDFVALDDATAATLSTQSWDIFYLGYQLSPPEADNIAENSPIRGVDPSTPIRLTHAMMIRNQAIGLLIAYLEAMLSRPAGDKKGGPMHVDGAYSWFRRDHPEITTLLAAEPWAVQRASRTDVHGSSWKNRIPFVDFARRLRNRLRGA